MTTGAREWQCDRDVRELSKRPRRQLVSYLLRAVSAYTHMSAQYISMEGYKEPVSAYDIPAYAGIVQNRVPTDLSNIARSSFVQLATSRQVHSLQRYVKPCYMSNETLTTKYISVGRFIELECMLNEVSIDPKLMDHRSSRCFITHWAKAQYSGCNSLCESDVRHGHLHRMFRAR